MSRELSAAAFAHLRLRYGATPEAGELPAVVEHDFADGRMADQYLAVPAPALLGEESVRALPAVADIRFLQQAEGGWLVLLCAPDFAGQAEFTLAEEEFRRLLPTLPGEPGFVPIPPQ